MATQQETQLAGIAYAGLILCLVPPVLIFFAKKDQSDYLKFHSLQAVGFALVAVSLNFIFGIIAFVLNIVPFVGGFIGWIISSLLMLVLIVYWIAISVQVFRGKNVRIPLLADYIENTLMKG